MRRDGDQQAITIECGNLSVYYYSAKPSESSITVKPCLVVVSGGSMYLVE